MIRWWIRRLRNWQLRGHFLISATNIHKPFYFPNIIQQKLPETCPDGLVDSFAENKIKLTQWDAFLRKNRLDVGPDSFLDVVRQVRGFIEAILGRINFV